MGADSPPYSVLLASLQAASVALSGTSTGSPERALIFDTDPDWDECCGSDGKGRLAVWGEPLVPTSEASGKPCSVVYGLNVVVQVLRCADSLTDDAMQAQARNAWEDTWALVKAVCEMQEDGWLVRVRTAGVVGEDGGCIAVELRMLVTVKPRR